LLITIVGLVVGRGMVDNWGIGWGMDSMMNNRGGNIGWGMVNNWGIGWGMHSMMNDQTWNFARACEQCSRKIYIILRKDLWNLVI